MNKIRAWFPYYWPNAAGRVSFSWRGFGFHILPRSGFRMWGFRESWYDGPWFELGFGPFLLIVWRFSFFESFADPRES